MVEFGHSPSPPGPLYPLKQLTWIGKEYSFLWND